MDLLYMPEMLSSASYRTYTHYSEYEQPWNKNYYSNYGSGPYEQRCQRVREVKTTSKNCDLCKESKRRGLSKYIKSKTSHLQNKNICSRICEEDEETEEKSIRDCSVAKNRHLSKNT